MYNSVLYEFFYKIVYIHSGSLFTLLKVFDLKARNWLFDLTNFGFGLLCEFVIITCSLIFNILFCFFTFIQFIRSGGSLGVKVGNQLYCVRIPARGNIPTYPTQLEENMEKPILLILNLQEIQNFSVAILRDGYLSEIISIKMKMNEREHSILFIS